MKNKPIAPPKKQHFALRSFLWGVCIAAAFVVPTMIANNGMFIYYGDYNVQVIPFYQLMVDAVHSGQTGWSVNTDLGSSFVGAYTFYNLFSPFFALLLLFPSSAVPYVMGPMTILKFGVSSLTAYAFLRRYAKNKNHAVMGAVLYAFSGAAVYNMVFHFSDAMALFPLLLCAMDLYIYENKRGVFALTALLCAVTNYYFFGGELVFCMMYLIVRTATRSYKTDSRQVFYLIFETILGTGMATFVLLPSAYHVVGNGRISQDSITGIKWWAYESGYAYITMLISFFMPPELPNADVYVADYSHTWSSVTAYLPLFGMAGVFAILFNKNKHLWMRIFYGVCAVFMFVPILNASFSIFTNAHYTRWFFMLLLIMSMGAVTALEDPSTKWKQAIGADLALTLAVVLAVAFTPYSETSIYGIKHTTIGIAGNVPVFWTLTAVAAVNIALCAVFVALYRKKRAAFEKIGALILALAVVITMASSYIPNRAKAIDGLDPVKSGLIGTDVSDIGIDDISQHRSEILTDMSYVKTAYDADTVSTADYALLEAANDKYAEELIYSGEGTFYEQDDNMILAWGLPTFGSFHSAINKSIVDIYKGLGFERSTLSSLPLGMYGVRSITDTKYLFNHTDSVLQPYDENDKITIPGYSYLKSWNGFDIYENNFAIPMGTVYDKFMISSEFEEIPEQYRHLVLADTLVIGSFSQTWKFVACKMKQSHAADYDFTRKEFAENVAERTQTAAEKFEYVKNGFNAEIEVADSGDGAEGKYVFFAIPYDKGWKATVNGEAAEVDVVDYGFMAVKVPMGQKSTISFTYHTPGRYYGIFASVVCLIALILYLAIEKLRAQAELADAAGDGSDPDNKGNAENEKSNDAADNKENSENTDDDKTSSEENKTQEEYDEMSVFDIVKQTEEEHMMHTYNRVPVVLERGSGAVGYDIDNKKYIDFTSGIGVNALGYADGRWIDAVSKQLRSVQHTSNLYYNTTQITLAEMLCMKTGFSKVFFANSGAEANECAIKIARKYGSDTVGEEHTHIITLENSFHGRTITTLSATGQDVFHKHFKPFTEGFSFAKANDMDSVKACKNENTCAVMIELIQGEGGVNPLDKKFVTELAQYCKDNDLLLIVDEIQTGVGRTGRLYCYENYGIQPDVITSAKALGGGLPLSACLCSEKLKDVMTPGSNGTTFGGNPIACAGALKILEIVADDEFLADVRAKGEYMRDRISKMKGVKEVRGLGLMIGIVLEKNNAADVLNSCAENGLLVLTAKGLIRLLPPLNIEREDIDEGLDILEKVIGGE